MDLTLNVPSIDKEASTDGVWLDYQPDISFRIARDGNPGYKKAINTLYKVNKTFIDNKTLSDEQSNAMMNKIIATYILVDWKGLKNGDEDFPYSIESAIELLSDERYGELRTWIITQSKQIENYRSEEQKK